VRLVCLPLQHTNEGGEPSSHDVVIEVVICREPGSVCQPKTSEVAAARKMLVMRAKLRFTGAAAGFAVRSLDSPDA
jgi:hypothetical protein